jgi:hypothetical protein
MSYEQKPSLELAVPSNIHELLDTALVPADELNTLYANTEKFYLQDHPELFIRLNRGNALSWTNTCIELGNQMREYGVNVLPSSIVEYSGEAFVVTKKVTGRNLDKALALNRDTSLVSEADETWKNLVGNLIQARNDGRSVPGDVENAHQYMSGCIEGDDGTPRIWLVDLPQFQKNLSDDTNYADMVLYLAGGIIDLENLSGTKMSVARKAVKNAIDLIHDNDSWAGRVARASKYVLRHSVELSPESDSEQINSMFKI